MPPPSWIPDHSTGGGGSSSQGSSSGCAQPPTAPSDHPSISCVSDEEEGMDVKPDVEDVGGERDADNQEEGDQARVVLDTPLATMLPPELADRDVTDWFPEFRRHRVST